MAEIKQQGDGKYSVRIGNQKFNGLSKQEAQRRADSNYQVAPDSVTDSPNQKKRNLALGVQEGDSDAVRDYALKTGSTFDPTAPVNANILTGNNNPIPLAPAPSSITQANSLITSVGETQGAQTQAQADVAKQEAEVAKQQGALGKLASSFNLSDQYAKLQKKQGIPNMVKSLQEANLQLTQMQSQYQAQNQELAQQAIPDAFVIGQQNELSKAAAIKITAQASYVQALQGNLDLANHYVDKMIDFQAQDYERQYNVQKDNLNLALGFLDRADAKLAQEVQYNMDIKKADYMDLLDQKKSTMQNMLLNGAPAAQIQEAAGAESVEALMSAAGRYGVDAMAQSALATDRAERETQRLQQEKLRAELAPTTTSELSQAKAQGSISETSELIKSKGLDSAVGTTIFSRGAGGFKGIIGRFLAGAGAGAVAGGAGGALVGGVGAIPGAIIGAVAGGVITASQGVKDTVTGERQDFIAGVSQLTKGLTLNNLINAKADGATFGALAIPELVLLEESATKLNSWAIKKDEKIIGYNASEKSVTAELNKINNYAKLDAVLKGSTPESVGVTVMEDGTYWAQNSDGSLTRIR